MAQSEVFKLKDENYGQYKKRCVILGEYIKENGATVRSTASEFGISKSTVHKDITEKLKKTDKKLYCEVRRVLEKNKEERHIRGGLATKKKYKTLRETVKKK